MRISEILSEISRRGFLGALGAGALGTLGYLGSDNKKPQSEYEKPATPSAPMSELQSLIQTSKQQAEQYQQIKNKIIIPNNLPGGPERFLTTQLLKVRPVASDAEIAQWLAQVRAETNNFTTTSENFNYSTPQKLFGTFTSKFVSDANKISSAERDRAITKAENLINVSPEYKQPFIANFVYAGKLGNGSELSGDGWKYRGRGFLQITGKNLYMLKAGPAAVNNPDLLCTDLSYALNSSLTYWLNSVVPKISNWRNSMQIIQSINKYLANNAGQIKKRSTYFQEYLKTIPELADKIRKELNISRPTSNIKTSKK